MFHPQTRIFQSLLQFWSKTCWSEYEPFTAFCSFSPSTCWLLHFTSEEHGFCEHEVEYEKILGLFKTTRFSTTGIKVRKSLKHFQKVSLYAF